MSSFGKTIQSLLKLYNALFEVFWYEVARVVMNPRYLPNILKEGTIRRFCRHIVIMFKFRRGWVDSDAGQGFKVRDYPTHEDYVAHQQSKRDTLSDLSRRHDKMRLGLPSRLVNLPFLKEGMVVLCLGARTGGEVEAFLNLDYFAVGVDVNPGKNNPFVVYGDFHAIQFPAKSVDVVYTNSLDHALDIKQVISEIKRVLKPNGYLILEPMRGKQEEECWGFWDSLSWERIDDLLGLFRQDGFKKLMEQPFEGGKRQISFQRV